MSQEHFLLFHTVILAIETLLYGVFIAVFFHPFTGETLGRRNALRKCPGKKELLVFLIYTGTYLAPFRAGWQSMVLIMVLLTASAGLLGMERRLVFLLGVIFYCVRSLVMMILQSVNDLTSGWFLRNADTPEKVYRSAALNYLLVACLQLALFYGMLRAVRALLKKREIALHTKELCYLLLTPVTGILFVAILLRLLVISGKDQVILLYETYPAFLGLVPATAILFYLGILAAIASCQKVVCLQEQQKKHFVEQQQILAIRERLEEEGQFYESIRRMKHEMKNHMTNIQGLMESGHYGDMEKYIRKMDESMSAFELVIQTGNAVTDVILNRKRALALKMGAEFRSDFHYPASETFDAYDIGIILSNLLQNALEACGAISGRPKYIFLSGRQKKKFYLITVKNSFQGEVRFDSHTRLPVSSKGKNISRDPLALHGIGLSNVKQTAARYGGDLDIRPGKNEFCVTVLLQERSQK